MFALLGKPGFEELKAELEERCKNKSVGSSAFIISSKSPSVYSN